MQKTLSGNSPRPFQGRHPGDQMAQLQVAKQRAAEEKTLPALPLMYMNPNYLMGELVTERRNWETQKEFDKNFRVRQTYIGHEADFSSSPLERLEPVLLKDMKVRQHHKGRFLLCRIIAPPHRLVGTSLAIEDPQGWAQILSLYNYPGTYGASGEELDAIFPINSIIAVREPYPKMALAASHSHIRVDSPTDFVVLDSGDPHLRNVTWVTGARPLPFLTKTAAEWKASGDKHFKAKQFYGAISCYSFSLSRNPSHLAARLNRSLANLRVQRYREAIQDAQKVLSYKNIPLADQSKALYRCAQGFYGEEDYASARTWYSKCLSIDPNLTEAALGIQRCESRTREQLSGTYDWYAMHEWTQGPFNTDADVADFIGPVEKISMESRGGGRGIVATRNISVGELLVVSKPFASATPTNFVSEGAFFGMNFLTNTVQDEYRYVLIQKAIERAMNSSHDAASLMDLYAGSKHTTSTPSAGLSEQSSSSLPINDVDSSRIQAICSLNIFGGDREIGREHENREDSKCALYTFPSYINHSCISNAERHTVGDIMVIRAVRGIKKGEEVTLSYCGHGWPYEQRTEILTTWFPRCDCPLCEQDRGDGEARRREERKRLLTRVSGTTGSTDKILSIAKEVDSTYTKGYPLYRQEVYSLRGAMAQEVERHAFLSIDNGHPNYAFPLLKESIREEFRAIEALGIHIINKDIHSLAETRQTAIPISTDCIPYQASAAVECCLAIVERFCCLREAKRAETWMRAAMWIEDTWVGGGVKLFKSKRGAELKRMGVIGEKLLLSMGQV